MVPTIIPNSLSSQKQSFGSRKPGENYHLLRGCLSLRDTTSQFSQSALVPFCLPWFFVDFMLAVSRLRSSALPFLRYSHRSHISLAERSSLP